jgi:branched-chain amino acid transport system substrate-binding protein
MRRTLRPIVVLLLVGGVACTGTDRPEVISSGPSGVSPSPTIPPQPSSSTSTGPSGPEPYVLDVVADLSPSVGGEEVPNTYLDGMRLAIDDVNALGGVGGRPLELSWHDDHGDPDEATTRLGEVLDGKPLAMLFVGPGTSVTPLRARIEEVGAPLFLLEGDLYTSRGLFPQVFQTTIPWEWQASAIGRYVVTDRNAKDITFIGEGPEAPAAETALRSALEYWGGSLAAGFTDEDGDPSTGLEPALGRAARSDWTVVYGPPGTVLDLVHGVEEAAGIADVRGSRPSPGVTGPSGLLAPVSGMAGPEPGTSAVDTYTWSGWAKPIGRVRDFRRSFKAMFGRLPDGLEQEGYDAIRLLRWALKETGGMGGPALVHAVESATDRTYSGFPVDLGPDDHALLPRDTLGLFAVAGPAEPLDPWEKAGSEPWRPIMRTFTSDGHRDDILDRDRPVFFPGWKENQPGPDYDQSRFGIVSSPSDPLH